MTFPVAWSKLYGKGRVFYSTLATQKSPGTIPTSAPCTSKHQVGAWHDRRQHGLTLAPAAPARAAENRAASAPILKLKIDELWRRKAQAFFPDASSSSRAARLRIQCNHFVHAIVGNIEKIVLWLSFECNGFPSDQQLCLRHPFSFGDLYSQTLICNRNHLAHRPFIIMGL